MTTRIFPTAQDAENASLWALTTEVRVPVGDGPWAATIELGAGVATPGAVCGIAEGRVAAGPLGLSGWVPVSCVGERVSPAWVLDLALPGKLGVF